MPAPAIRPSSATRADAQARQRQRLVVSRFGGAHFAEPHGELNGEIHGDADEQDGEGH